MPDRTIGANDRKLSGDGMELGLENDNVCAKALLLINPMVLCTLEVGGDSTSQDSKKIDNEASLTGLLQNLLGLESTLIPVNIVRDIVHRGFSGESRQHKKIFLADTTSQADAKSLGVESFN